MLTYRTNNKAQFHKRAFVRYMASEIKAKREDFADLFTSEAEFRRKRGDLSVVFCLTYNDEHLCHKYGQNMVCGDDLKMYSKSSRFAKMLMRKFGYSFDMVSVGEYGCGGETHDKRSVRGFGQNPHFHCAGWFHRCTDKVEDASKVLLCLDPSNNIYIAFDGVVPCNHTLIVSGLYDVLCSLVRYEWQKTFHKLPELYGMDKVARSRGLGFVNLQGELRSSYSGASYFSKYIGKDIRSIWKDSYIKGFAPFFLGVVIDAIRELYKGVKFDVKFPYDDLCVAKWILCKFVKFRLYKGLLDFDLFVGWLFDHNFDDFDGFEFPDLIHHFDLFKDKISETYQLFYEDFMSDLNGNYSPKVRKFHGFGYSLADDEGSDKLRGKYQVNGIDRDFPACIKRHLYYDFHVVPCAHPSVLCRSDKVVKYTLNDLGRKYLKNRLRAAVERDVVICRSLGSEHLKKHALVVSILKNCLLAYDIEQSKFHFDKWFDYTKNLDSCLDFCVALRPISVYPQHTYEERTFVNVWYELRQNRPLLFSLVRELDDLHRAILSSLNQSDMEFSQHWLRVYKSNF